MVARVRPHKLPQIVACPGSLQLEESVAPLPTTEEQAEGQLAHLVALKHAMGAKAEWGEGRKVTVDGHVLEIDEDMVEGAAMYLEEATPHAGARYEQSVLIPDVHFTDCSGTPDYWRVMLSAALNLLKVIDYKYGHRPVEVFEHYQLIAYAMGVARFLGLTMDFPVSLIIVQPRDYTQPSVREWKTTVGELHRICVEVIAPQVRLALEPNPPTKTGRHCLDCRARHVCRTLQIETAQIVDFSGTAESQIQQPVEIGQELRILKEAVKRLDARYTGLYEHALRMGQAGMSIPHWHMEPGKGRLQWMDDTTPESIIALGDMLGVDLRKPLKSVTPTQAITAGIEKEVIDSYAHRPSGAMKLVQDDTVHTRKIFGDNRK
jgi:hypothetical protein